MPRGGYGWFMMAAVCRQPFSGWWRQHCLRVASACAVEIEDGLGGLRDATAMGEELASTWRDGGHEAEEDAQAGEQGREAAGNARGSRP